MPVILHVETATNVCSVALSKGEKLLAIRESDEDKSHNKLLTIFMDEVMKEAGIDASGIDAIAVSKGPGSYTGLRIGVSVTKGFAYGRNIPVIGVITLQAMAAKALAEIRNNPDLNIDLNEDVLLCPMIDARRMEVFSALYTSDLKEYRKVEAEIIDEKSFKDLLKSKKIVFFGNGADKIKETVQHENALYLDKLQPSATSMIELALEDFKAEKFEDTAYFEPFYLKDFVATTPKKKVL